ncbi:MAG: HIT domain-containing protein [Gammaproteobacteria bacterium]
MTEFKLHPQLAQDCLLIKDLKLSRLLLMNNSDFPWCILVPRRVALTELHDLTEADQVQFLHESSSVCRAMQNVFASENHNDQTDKSAGQCGKMNIASLGNIVPQLHVHHVLRYPHDAAWPKPVWGFAPATPYAEEHGQLLCEKLASVI